MRHWLAGAALLTAALGGCFSEPPRQLGLFDPSQPFMGPVGEDVVQIDMAVVEREPGDLYLNGGLWQDVNEQSNLERKQTLEDNGFRIGRIGTLPPTLLTARSCPEPHRKRLHAGSGVPLPLGPVWKECKFQLCEEDHPQPVQLKNAQCYLEVVPVLGEEGRLTLRFVPHVRHGQPSFAPRAVKEACGTLRWQWDMREPDEAYPDLGWELDLDEGEYVVVGTRLDHPGTLGHCCFLPAEGEERKQLLLVVRASRVQTSPPANPLLNRATPLALQAGGWNVIRASSP